MEPATVTKRYTYRAYPTVEQETHIAQTFGCVRVVFNKYVEHGQAEKWLSQGAASKQLTQFKQDPEYVWLKDVSAVALQQTLLNATKAVSRFFENKKKPNPDPNVELPKFKKRGGQESYRVTGDKDFAVLPALNKRWGQVRLPKMAPLKYRIDRALPSTPSSATVIKRPSGKYFVSFVVEVPVRAYAPPTTAEAAGLDAGLTALLTIADSNGVTSSVLNPRYYRKLEARLANAQRIHSQKEKGSINREKARLRSAKLSEKIANQRLDHARKLSKDLVAAYGLLSLETLSVTSMVKNHRLAKSIHDASWSTLYQLLEKRAVEAGRVVARADRYQPTTKVCSSCATVLDHKLGLNVREWVCACGAVHDRDVNAAKVLLSLATEPNRWKSGDSLEGTNTSNVVTQIGTTLSEPVKVFRKPHLMGGETSLHIQGSQF